MPLDIAALATTVVSGYLIPYVTKGLEKIGQEVKERVGEAASEHVTKVTGEVWNMVKSLFTDKDELILLQLEARPEAAKPLVETILAEKLEADPGKASALNELVNAENALGGGTAVQIMQNAGIAVAVTSSNFSGASNFTIGPSYGSVGPGPSPGPGPINPLKKE